MRIYNETDITGEDRIREAQKVFTKFIGAQKISLSNIIRDRVEKMADVQESSLEMLMTDIM